MANSTDLNDIFKAMEEIDLLSEKRKKDKEILIITLIGGLLNIILNYFLITKYEILGAAWASLLTQLLVLILFMYLFYYKVSFFKNVKKIS